MILLWPGEDPGSDRITNQIMFVSLSLSAVESSSQMLKKILIYWTRRLVHPKAWQGHVQKPGVQWVLTPLPEANSRRRRDCLPSSFLPPASSSSTATGKELAPSVLRDSTESRDRLVSRTSCF